MSELARMTEDELDGIEAQMDSTSPHYLVRLLREARLLREERDQAEAAWARLTIHGGGR